MLVLIQTEFSISWFLFFLTALSYLISLFLVKQILAFLLLGAAFLLFRVEIPFSCLLSPTPFPQTFFLETFFVYFVLHLLCISHPNFCLPPYGHLICRGMLLGGLHCQFMPGLVWSSRLHPGCAWMSQPEKLWLWIGLHLADTGRLLGAL